MVGKNINHFMWGFQSYLRLNFQTKAESLFGNFSKNLQPKVHLIGIRNEDTNEIHPICAEIDSTNKEDVDSFVKKFDSLHKIATKFEMDNYNGTSSHSRSNAYKCAIKHILKKHH